MVEKLENQVCQACGVDVRSKALFCYNCGLQVASDEMVAESEKAQEITQTGPKTAVTSKLDKIKVAKPIITDKSIETTLKKPAKLRTAGALRDKSKLTPKKKVEVVWEEPHNAPNIWFLLVSLILVLFAGCVLSCPIYW